MRKKKKQTTRLSLPGCNWRGDRGQQGRLLGPPAPTAVTHGGRGGGGNTAGLRHLPSLPVEGDAIHAGVKSERSCSGEPSIAARKCLQ